MSKKINPSLALSLLASLILGACSAPAAQPAAPGKYGGETLVVYSGRSENLVGPVIDMFEQASGIDVQVRWGSTSELAATLLEEGARSQADVFFAQDPGGLGAVEGMLAPLPVDITSKVPEAFRDENANWVGVSGRARVVVYNTNLLSPQDLPQDMWGFTDPRWKGKIGWAPTNASFQTMISAMRSLWGEEETRRWLDGILANEPVALDNNSMIVSAVGSGEIEVGFTNHYYLFRFLQEEGESFPARNYFLTDGGPGSLVMPAGVGRLSTGQNPEAAERFIEFLLSPVAQQYFATQTYEYPVVEGVVTHRELPDLEIMNIAQVEPSRLTDMQGTVQLLRSSGALP
jgi:iron(III) transport system substrate-binding protein